MYSSRAGASNLRESGRRWSPRFTQVTLAALQKLETGKSRGNDLNSKQGL
jgi:hypothetical protein